MFSCAMGSWVKSSIGVGLLLVAGCSSDHDGSAFQNPSSSLELTLSDDGSSVEAVVGEKIDVTLGTVGPGEYGTPSMSSGSVRFLSVSLAPVQTPAGPTQVFHFVAEAAGSAELTIPHTVQSEAFIVTIVVK